jgi:hypothetical protein
MGNFLDNTARILATPAIPRRHALRRIGCVLLGAGVFGALTGCNLQCGGKWYCVTTNTCCPSGYGYSCGGECFQDGCPANLPQQSLCS